MNEADAERRCRSAGQMWSSPQPETFLCSGSAGAPLPFHVDMFTCSGHLCRLVLSQHAPRALDRLAAVEKELEGNYGPPSASETNVPGECTEGALAECLRSGRAKARAAWRWDSGYTLTATLQSSGRDVFVFVTYSSPTFGESVRASGL